MSEKMREADRAIAEILVDSIRSNLMCLTRDRAIEITLNTFAALSPAAAPTADDAERAWDIALQYGKLGMQKPLREELTAAFASIRASQAADIAALEGELLAVREAARKVMHLITGNTLNVLLDAVNNSAPRAAAIEREWRETYAKIADAHAIGEPASCVTARTIAAAIRAANATGETNGEG